MRSRFPIATAALAYTLLFTGVAYAQDYDLVVSNGRVMDPETFFDAVANIGIHTDLEATFLLHLRHEILQRLSRHQGHLADRITHRKHAALAHIGAQDLGKGPG